MIRLFSTTTGLPIFSIDTGFTDYKLAAFVVDVDRLAIELVVIQQSFSSSKYYLMSQSVQEIGRYNILINSESDITDAEDLVRYQTIIGSKPYLIGYKVVTMSGQRLGQVKDFGYDATHLTVAKLIVRSHWSRRLVTKDLIINRSQIIKIEGQTVVVKEPKAKARKTSAKLLPA